MDHVAISENQVTPLDAIEPGVLGLRIVFVNVFAVTHPDGSWTLIDAALPFSDGMIRRWAEKHFTAPLMQSFLRTDILTTSVLPVFLPNTGRCRFTLIQWSFPTLPANGNIPRRMWVPAEA